MTRPGAVAHYAEEIAIHAIMLGTSRAAKLAGLVLLAVLAGLALTWLLVNGLVPIILLLVRAWPWWTAA